MKDLSGLWSIVHAEMNGDDITAAFSKERLEITDKLYKVWNGNVVSDSGELVFPGAAALDIIGKEGPNKVKTFACIYQLKGSILTICYNLTNGGQRPLEFVATPVNKYVLIQYKPVKQ